MQSSNLLDAPNCDTFFNRTFNLERYLTACSEPAKMVYPKNLNQIRKNLFDKLDSFGFKYTSEQRFSKNIAKLDSKSICLQEATFRDRNIKTWLGKHVLISVSNSSNLVEEPISFCKYDRHHIVGFFTEALESLVS